jgi:hypothetical protein
MSYVFGLRSSNWSQSSAFQVTPIIVAEHRTAEEREAGRCWSLSLCSLATVCFRRFQCSFHDFLSFAEDDVQMISVLETLRIDFVNVLGSARTRCEPAASSNDFHTINWCLVAGRVRQLAASLSMRSNHLRSAASSRLRISTSTSWSIHAPCCFGQAIPINPTAPAETAASASSLLPQSGQ